MKKVCKALGAQKRRLIPKRRIWEGITKEALSPDLKGWEEFWQMEGKC